LHCSISCLTVQATPIMVDGHSSNGHSQAFLYSWDGCPWAHRARVAAKAVGLDVQLVPVNPGDKPDWYKPNVNPAGKVPAIWYQPPPGSDPTHPPEDAIIIPESAIIVDFLLSLFPGKVGSGDPVVEAYSQLVALSFEERVWKHWRPFTQSAGTAEDREVVFGPLRAWTKEWLDARNGDFVKRTQYTKGDILIATLLPRLFDWTELEAGAWDEGAGKKAFDILQTDPAFSNLRRYYDKLTSWEAYVGTHNKVEVAAQAKKAALKARQAREAVPAH